MRIYDIAFCIFGFFILGVFVASFKINLLIIGLATVLAAVLFLFFGYFKSKEKFFWLAGLSLIIIVGAFYYFWWDKNQIKNINIVFDKKINFSGIVVEYPKRGNQQELTIKLQSPYQGKILVKLKPYPSFDYGDLINFEGVIKEPESKSYANYLIKDGIFGVANYPESDLVSKNQGSAIKALLFKLKEKIVIVFQKTLAPEKSAFLAGITLGERAEFSKEFKEAMAKSGTTHLVALSGYNITILTKVIMGIFLWFLSRRRAFFLAILAILGFVFMTGAEASVVRAAIMGLILLLAEQSGRIYNARNSIAVAAFLMILFNPKILKFDIGFQLSFLSLLGIVYFSPAIQKFFRIKEGPGFLYWRENLLATISAQLMVAPVLISSFSVFSPLSFIPNVLILGFMPLTMALGFILGFMGLISFYLSFLLAIFLNLFLSYEIFLIKFFGQFSGLEIKEFSLCSMVIYYLIIILFVLYNWFLNKQKTNQAINSNPMSS